MRSRESVKAVVEDAAQARADENVHRLQPNEAQEMCIRDRIIPFFMISAIPEIEVRGVFSSWETLAVNSRRSVSRSSCSVISSITITAPITDPS